mgnify:CR=1 FL=1
MSELVAVTGAEGFIGSHLVEALVAEGNRVRAMVQYNSFASWGWLETLDPEVMANVEVVLGDVRDAGSVLGFAKDIEVLYHLAALIAIPYSYEAPRSYLDTNAGGTLNVLEAARTLGTARVVHTSTSEVYGTARTVPISEEHPLQGQSPYSASKAALESLLDLVGEQVYAGMEGLDALLLGRRTYDIFAAYWPDQDEGTDGGIARLFNRVPKYVASRGAPTPGAATTGGDS